MRFIDEVSVNVQAGKGGDGCVSFKRGPNLPRGGPDGGNGGDGGDVVFEGSSQLRTLLDLQLHPLVRAQNGRAGSGQNRTGARGHDRVVRIPCGSTIIDDETLLVLGDITEPGQSLRVATGGRHGTGNAAFKSSTNRSPRTFTKGEVGEKRSLRLQLKLLADVGLFGLPNAGKSTLLSRISKAKPKIADYPFTTLEPQLGVVRSSIDESFVVADIPGLIRGASQGAGIGFRFLRHLSRTSFLLHLVELDPWDGSNALDNIKALEHELLNFSHAFKDCEIWIVATKNDVQSNSERQQSIEELRAAFPHRKVMDVSAVTGEGLQELIYALSERIRHLRAKPSKSVDDVAITFTMDILNHELEARRERAAKKKVAEQKAAEIEFRRG